MHSEATYSFWEKQEKRIFRRVIRVHNFLSEVILFNRRVTAAGMHLSVCCIIYHVP